ncbi:MAG: hypothetical protein KDC98_11695 [Planctomycetes bacterium]|nr:hypothetical protein [Planctomycetota bacterium]
MSGRAPKDPGAGGQDFREALAHWRLEVHTEVKKTSSLPTAMFDATDPMLEMRLAETTEAMLAQLLQPHAHITASADQTERRLERIPVEELRQLPARIAARPPVRLDLLADLGSEYVAVLADACCSQDAAISHRAASHLCVDFGITAESLDSAMADLRELVAAGPRTESGSDAERTETNLHQVEAALRELTGATPAGTRQP